jgi:hypothetical protein
MDVRWSGHAGRKDSLHVLRRVRFRRIYRKRADFGNPFTAGGSPTLVLDAE